MLWDTQYHPTGKNHLPAHPTHHPKWHNWHTYTQLLLLLIMYDKLAIPVLTISQCDH